MAGLLKWHAEEKKYTDIIAGYVDTRKKFTLSETEYKLWQLDTWFNTEVQKLWDLYGESEKFYEAKANNLNGGTVNAAFGTPLECIPSSGTLEVVAPKTGSYIISGKINIGTDLNKDNGAIELAYGIDTGSGAVVSSKPWVQVQQAKKNRANGIQGVWGEVSLNQGDVVHLFLSTLSDSTTWTEGEIWIATWA